MKVLINIPENLNEITIEQYQRFYTLVNNNEPSDFVSKKTIEILCDFKDAHLLPFHEVEEILNQLNKVFEQKPKFTQRFDNFGFIPSLDTMTFGEYIDLNSYIDKPEDAHKAMAVLYRPIATKFKDLYTIEKYEGSEKYAEQMKSAPLGAYLGAKVFFYDLANELLANTLSSLTDQERQTIQTKLNSLQGGDGIQVSIQSLEGMLRNLIVLQN